jgi:signal peptidase II
LILSFFVIIFVAMKMRSRNFISLLIMFSTVGCDQITKAVAKEILQFSEPLVFLKGTFWLIYSENSGAFMSLGSELSDGLRFFLFTVLVGIFLSVAAIYLLRKTIDLWSTVAYALLIGGGIGNLIDRMTNGQVVDFMHLGIGDIRTGIFNMADVFILSAVAILFVRTFTQKKSLTRIRPE